MHKSFIITCSLEILVENMVRKKIPIGCILAVALLTLVSFSSVVGYSSVKSDSKIASPLFSIRNKKGDISSNYLGKGKVTNLLLPKRNSETKSFDIVINIINRMDDKSFDRFVDLIITLLHQKGNFQEFDETEFALSLNQLRDNPNEIKPYSLNDENIKLWTLDCPSVGCTFELNFYCMTLLIMVMIIGVIELIITFFTFSYCWWY